MRNNAINWLFTLVLLDGRLEGQGGIVVEGGGGGVVTPP